VKQLAVFLILGVSLTGCSSTPLELPSCEVPAPMGEVATLQAVPDMPVETSSNNEGAFYDLEGLLQFERLRATAASNKEVGELNAAALQARNEEVNALIECVRYQNVWMEVREDMLEQERNAHQIDNLWHRGVIALGVIAVAL
jgi:predicted small lipoprotein YifL